MHMWLGILDFINFFNKRFFGQNFDHVFFSSKVHHESFTVSQTTIYLKDPRPV